MSIPKMSVQDAEAMIRESAGAQAALSQAATLSLLRLGKATHEPWVDAVNDKPPGDLNLAKAYDLVQREGVVQEDGMLIYKNQHITIKNDGYGIAVARNLDGRIMLEGDGISGVASLNNLERRDAAAIDAASQASHQAGAKESLPSLRTLAQEFGTASQDKSTTTFSTDSYRIVTDGDQVKLYRQGSDVPVLSGSANSGVLTENNLSTTDRQVLADVPSETQLFRMKNEVVQQAAVQAGGAELGQDSIPFAPQSEQTSLQQEDDLEA